MEGNLMNSEGDWDIFAELALLVVLGRDEDMLGNIRQETG